MSLENQNTIRILWYEGPGTRPVSPQERYEIAKALLDKGYALSCSGPEKASLSEDDQRQSVLVLGRFDGEVALPGGCGSNVQVQDLQNPGAREAVSAAEKFRANRAAVEPGSWKPWFPVIDYDRCTNCMQCLSFCLFGVYGVDGEQRIQVQNSQLCKTNCPACSRVCPEAAIIFPKYKSGPINGDQVQAADLEREKMKVDISSLLGGDVYDMLRQRSERAQSRFSKERDSDKALNERQKCLAYLVEAGDIPPEVLSSLPSQEEILRRAEEAKARAAAITSRRKS